MTIDVANPEGQTTLSGTAATAFLEDPTFSFAKLKANKLAALADRRWQAETDGVNFNGATIRTDDKSQAKITGAVTLFANDPDLVSIKWEATPGVIVEVDKTMMTAIGIAVGRHSQACFARSAELTAAINAASDATALAAIDIDTGWPD